MSIYMRLIQYVLVDLRRFARYKRMMKDPVLEEALLPLLQETSSDDGVVVYDLETTGFYPQAGDEMISIGAVRSDGSRFYSLVRPSCPVPPVVEELTGITEEHLQEAPSFPAVMYDFAVFCRGCLPAAYPASFDHAFLQHLLKRWDLPLWHKPCLDIQGIYQHDFPDADARLQKASSAAGFTQQRPHHALEDAEAAFAVFRYVGENRDDQDSFLFSAPAGLQKRQE
ncbi:3'-5' exonuclease [Alkalicoccus chagannorensis]|uniref:3'-5' exonuclease n=1 Tax=Alkalicoccus chagannorensis TaxID=427072 RepID=UPI000415925C|nr:3'-5' exonuclease [Alkalicoccus chagannorensis]